MKPVTKEELLDLIGAYVDGETDEENMANHDRLQNAIRRLFEERDNYLPYDLSVRFVRSVDKLVDHARNTFVSSIALGAIGPGVRDTAVLFHEYDEARRAIVKLMMDRSMTRTNGVFPPMAALALVGLSPLLALLGFGGGQR